MGKLLIDKSKILEAKEKLGTDNAILIAQSLNVEKFDDKNFKGCCPYHEEKTPSWIYNDKTYSYHCFGCNRNTDIIDAFMQEGLTYIESVQKLFELVGMKCSFGEHGVKTKHQYIYPKEVICTDKEKVYQYFETRKISRKTVDYLDVRQDESGNAVFNFYDANDVLTTVKYKPSHKIKKGEAKTWAQKGADTTQLLFNMNRINTENPLLICEGEPDCMAAVECGYTNSVSIPFGSGNFQWIEENWDWLEQFDNIIICSDNDDPGVKMKKETVYRLGSWRTKFVDIPSSIIKNEKTVLIKDLNEYLYHCGNEKTLDLILNAKDTPIQGVVDYADIKDIDLDGIDGITTGIKDLDKSLMKLFFGTFTIVTGINGSGKSSFLSQLVCQCLNQDKKAFLFSGELPNFQSKNWINYIFAGQRHLNKCKFNDTVYWKVDAETKKELDEFYRDNLFIYEDGYSTKVSDMMKTMEDVVRKNGVKLLILDNLTALNLENNDTNKYEKQAELVANLIAFAKKYNVITMLVVHPHKIETMRRLSKMDIQGISAIIDLAHRILSLYRVSDSEKKGKPKSNGKGWEKEPVRCDVICDVLKDRLLGYEGGAEMYYDKPSKRFFTNEIDLDFKYKWDKTDYSSPLPFPPEQLNNDEDEVFGI